MIDYSQYDQIVADILDLLNRISTNNEIVLCNFTPNKKSNLLFFQLALFVQDIFNKQVKVKISFINYIQLKIKYKYAKFSYIPKNKEVKEVINVKELISYISEAIGQDEKMFENIFTEYYERNK